MCVLIVFSGRKEDYTMVTERGSGKYPSPSVSLEVELSNTEAHLKCLQLSCFVKVNHM